MLEKRSYDVAIVGGGLAGLSAAIEFRRQGHEVILIEKEQYPFHRVCGEYISNESRPYLQSMGIDAADMNLPQIDALMLTAPNGNSFQTKLALGGFGISRFTLDRKLFNYAISLGLTVLQKSKVEDIRFNEGFQISVNREDEQIELDSKLCIGSFGKRSNLDVKWKRNQPDQKNKQLQNYIGVKYHIRANWPANMIGLHNFENGYCGISKIEEDKFCLCYLSHASQLKLSGGSISQLEKDHLYKNPHLKKIFSESEFLEGFPVTISQISFKTKSKLERHVMMAGDAGGMITPLCGNGMSMALHSGKMAAEMGGKFLNGNLSRADMEFKYEREWKNEFGSRLRNGRMLQRFFGSSLLSNGFVSFFRTFPFFASMVIRQTHGKSF
jgi:flavin-dependent dehydrogenase